MNNFKDKKKIIFLKKSLLKSFKNKKILFLFNKKSSGKLKIISKTYQKESDKWVFINTLKNSFNNRVLIQNRKNKIFFVRSKKTLIKKDNSWFINDLSSQNKVKSLKPIFRFKIKSDRVSITKINLYNKFIGFLLKKGKINKSIKILKTVLFHLSSIYKNSCYYILSFIFHKLQSNIEARMVLVHRKKYLVPILINSSRSVHLGLRWLINTTRKNFFKAPFWKKLLKEILFILQNKKSKVLDLKYSNVNRILSNSSNLHFRW